MLFRSSGLRWVKIKFKGELGGVKTWRPWVFFTADGKKDETEGALWKERLWSINREEEPQREYAEIMGDFFLFRRKRGRGLWLYGRMFA